ncbi:MAG: hypothetical protein ACYDAI_17590 [Trichloromonadaceae bacterium]
MDWQALAFNGGLMFACITINAHPQTSLPILASVNHAFFSGLDDLLAKLDLCGHARIGPCTFTDLLDDTFSKWFEIDFVSFISNTALEKKPFDSGVLAEIVVGLMFCYLQHNECSYLLMDMDPDAYDPPLPEITDNINRSLKKFFGSLRPGKNFETNEVNCKYLGVELYCFGRTVKTPHKSDQFWRSLVPSEKPIDPRVLKSLAEPYTIKIIVGSTKLKKIRCFIEGLDGEFRVDFLENSFAGGYPIPETIMKVSAVLVNRTCYIFQLMGTPEYPPYLTVKEGYQLGSFNF